MMLGSRMNRIASRSWFRRSIVTARPTVGASIATTTTTTAATTPVTTSTNTIASYNTNNRITTAPFSTKAAVAVAKQKKAPLVDVRRQLWEFYVATGYGANALFEAIDLEEKGSVDPSALKSFMIEVLREIEGDDNVHPSDIMPYAWNRLEQREAAGQSYDMRAFKKWLVAATKMSADLNNSRMLELLRDQYVPEPTAGEDDKTAPEEDASFTWNEETMSQTLRRMQYAVRGEVVTRADQLASEGRQILYTNIGNPHQVGVSPITYFRQIMALCDLPAQFGVDHPKVTELFPADVVARAKEYREVIGPSGTGAYSHSQGILGLRKHVADYITERDGYPAYPGNIFLTNGASAAISMVLQGLLANNNDAVMIPIPQYPIYSALIAKLGGRQIGYELDEELNWSVSRDELESKLAQAKKQGLEVKAMALINPGNPSGNVMTHCDIQVVTEFCAEHGIVLMADEVYQANVYADYAEFVSARKVAMDCGLKNLQLVSFHSTSKGLMGECGRRGGYMDLHHIDPYVQSQLYKLASSELCAGVTGQLMTSMMLRPPLPGDESYSLYKEETDKIFEGLKERSQKLVEGLNKIDGISCVPAEGAMYAFPSVKIPEKAIEKAKELGTTPDNLYALSLLEETGICVVPASGFGQKKGRIGFRTTFLHPDTVKAVEQFEKHHKYFVEKYT